jgi:hypothetical protein
LIGAATMAEVIFEEMGFGKMIKPNAGCLPD